MTNAQRKLVFSLCRGLSIDDEGRRAMAGSFRKDGHETTREMDVGEAGLMIVYLKERWRQRQLKRRKRIDPGDPKIASERWRHRVAEQAKALFGANWQLELHQIIRRHNDKIWMVWYDPRMPASLWRKVSEEVKARLARAV